MPYLSEELNGMIWHLLKVHKIDVRILNPTPTRQKNVVKCTMRKCPMKSARCTSCYVVYKGVCELCNSSYVGSTGRQADEAWYDVCLWPALLPTTSTALPNITFNILQQTAREQLLLRISEAYWIRRLQPRINRNMEYMGTGFFT